MTIPRMEAIAERWEQVPPIPVMLAMVASALGVKVGGGPKKEAGDSAQELADMFGISEKPEWLKT